MVVDTQLYDLLGVKPESNSRQIKKAFLRKARELHPDKNRNDPLSTERFQELNEAYEILKDPNKRRAYDRFGLQGLSSSISNEEPDLFDLFTNHFGFDSFIHSGSRYHRPRTEDIQITIKATLEELYNGSTRKLRIKLKRLCSTCSGTGAKSGRHHHQCRVCQGKGTTVRVYRRGSVLTREVSTCRACQGRGDIVDSGDICPRCHGLQVLDIDKDIDVVIERGMRGGDTIVIRGESDEAPGADTGDLVFLIEEVPHAFFKRRGFDLLLDKSIDLSTALLGSAVSLRHLDGRTLVASWPSIRVIAPGTVVRIDGEGMPARGGVSRGSLFVRFSVTFPSYDDITPQLSSALRALDSSNCSISDIGVDESDENTFFVEARDADGDTFGGGGRRRTRREAYRDDESSSDEERSCGVM